MKLGYYLDRLAMCGETKAVGRHLSMLEDMGHEVLLFTRHMETDFDFGLRPIVVSGMTEVAAQAVEALICTTIPDFRKTRASGCPSLLFHQVSDLDRLRDLYALRLSEQNPGAVRRTFLGLGHALRRRTVRRHYRSRVIRWVAMPYLQKMFWENFGQETSLVRDYVDSAVYHPASDSAQRPRTVLCIGDSQFKHHNVAFACESLRRIKVEQPFRLVRVSPRPIPASEQAQGWADEYHVIESDAQMAELYRQADALVAPYLAEGVGLMALEAMACRTLCLLSSIEPHQRYGDALPEPPPQHALYFDPRSPEALASLVQRLFRQPQVFERVRDAGHTLSRFYTPEGARSDLLQALGGLAAKRKK